MPEIPQVLTAGLVLNIMSILISLACSYFPVLRDWFAAKDGANKVMTQFVIIVLLCLVAGILSWTGVWVLIPATRDGVIGLLIICGTALVSNQTTYGYTKDMLPASVKKIKAARE